MKHTNITTEAMDQLLGLAGHAVTYQTGQLVEGRGIYLCVWKPWSDTNRAFNIFASPSDLKGSQHRGIFWTYNEAIKEVAQRKKWHGHDGGKFETDLDISESLATGHYRGEWFIPPIALLDSAAEPSLGAWVFSGGLYQNRTAGAFSDTLTTRRGSGSASWYWSSSENKHFPGNFFNVAFNNGSLDCHSRSKYYFVCRPCRAEEIKL